LQNERKEEKATKSSITEEIEMLRGKK